MAGGKGASPWRWSAVRGVGAVLIGLLTVAASAGAQPSGRDLFTGAVPLAGRLYTQSEDLPAVAVRCANCHTAGGGAPLPRSNAPSLGRSMLTERRSRRGGPRTAYNSSSFCALLRTGIDPAGIVINVEMPRYALGAPDCAALWAYLTEASE